MTPEEREQRKQQQRAQREKEQQEALDAYVAAIVRTFRPLTPSELDELAQILWPGGDPRRSWSPPRGGDISDPSRWYPGLPLRVLPSPDSLLGFIDQAPDRGSAHARRVTSHERRACAVRLKIMEDV